MISSNPTHITRLSEIRWNNLNFSFGSFYNRTNIIKRQLPYEINREDLQNISSEGCSIKIAIFHMGFFFSGGGERTVINEAINLEKRGHQVTVYAPLVRPAKCFPDLINKINVSGYLPKLPIAIPMREA